MEKERIIAKFKDNSKELEKILTYKTFSETAKNLLLNMFYKIENSYEDYEKTKVEVPTKNLFFQELLDIIYKDCKTIEFINSTLEEKTEKNKIITYQNELSLLENLYKINSNKFNIKTTNSLIGQELSNLLNNGEEINKSEVIRDFDGWSWSTLEKSTTRDISSLIYIGLVYILGYYNLNSNKASQIENLENILAKKYKSSFEEKIIKNISQISIISYIKLNPNKKNEIIELRDNFKKQFEAINNKKEYIESITNEKKKCIIESEKINKYLNNDLLLKKEYIKQNEKLPQEERVFSLSDFSDKIERKKEVLLARINELTEKIKPGNYVREKNRIEKELNFYNEIELENFQLNCFLDEFVSLLLKTLTKKVNEATQKKEIIESIYKLRYLNLLKVDNTTIGNKYKKQICKTQKSLITKGCNLKMLNIFSKDVEENYSIYKNIFETRVIDLESMHIEINKENKIILYDDEAIEKEIEYNELKDLIVKYNRKYKILI